MVKLKDIYRKTTMHNTLYYKERFRRRTSYAEFQRGVELYGNGNNENSRIRYVFIV